MDKIQKLLEDLKSGDEWARMAAAEELTDMEDASAVPALVEALEDQSLGVRSSSAFALGHIADASAVPALMKALREGDHHLRRCAADALGKIGDLSSIPALVVALGDEDAKVRPNAANALVKILDKCGSIEDLYVFEKGLEEGTAFLRKKFQDKNQFIDVKMQLAKLLKKASEKKNQLASKRDMLLDDKPKPPKKGKTYKCLRARNG